MLILSRKIGESITIGKSVKISVLENLGNSVKIGIEAPKEVLVLRSELLDTLEQLNKGASDIDYEALQALKNRIEKEELED